MVEMDGGGILILTPLPRSVCSWLCYCPLPLSSPILSHFSLLSFVTLVTELYELIMGAPLLVASHWVWPIGGTCGGRRRDGYFSHAALPLSVSGLLWNHSCHPVVPPPPVPL